MILSNLIYLTPEIFVAIGSLLMLMYGAFNRQLSVIRASNLTAIILCFALGMTLTSVHQVASLFSGQFIADSFSQYLKIAILGGAALVLLSTRSTLYQDHIHQTEYTSLILLSVIGMMLMVSANSYLTLFVGLELQSLSLYIMTALKRDDVRASEAGVKYFILGALSTGLLLFGISFIYGATGSLLFGDTSAMIAKEGMTLSLSIGLVFIIAGLLFKISSAPFHMWTPDIYQGTPTSITTFLSTIPKLAAFALISRVLITSFGEGHAFWSQILMVLSIITMLVGSLAALVQKNIKRFLAYSTIANGGYALIGLIAGGQSGVQSILIYVSLYIVAMLGVFSCLSNLNRRGFDVEDIQDIAGINRVFPSTAFAMTFFLFSMAGVPPLAGFLGKLYVFNEAIKAGQISLAVIGVLTSVISAAYYLWVIKVIMMDPLDESRWRVTESYKRDSGSSMVIALSVIFLILFFIKPGVFIPYYSEAASSLFIR
ncbi:MAG: NADH-quinone oxidoreductase subunit N [Candidatus Paracaedibacteraceae bacterium]|nr:NADH-quinone oxidoreductase subunit N [Candidatus Paracaedibacteraceae bacterium]